MKKITTVMCSLFLIFTFMACDSGGGSSSLSDTSDPYAILSNIPDELEGQDSLESGTSSGISRATAPTTTDAQVYHSSVDGDETWTINEISNTSRSYTINLILRETANASVKATVDSGTPVYLGYITMDRDLILDHMGAVESETGMTIDGLMIDSIPASEGLNGLSGFAYYMYFRYVHSNGTLNIFSYFEVYAEDENNLTMRYCAYLPYNGTYYKFSTSNLVIENGAQSIERYENDMELTDDDTHWSYDEYTYNPSDGNVKVFGLVHDETIGWFVSTLTESGGAMLKYVSDDEDSGYNTVFTEIFENNGYVMERASVNGDIDHTQSFSTAFNSSSYKYSYRFYSADDASSNPYSAEAAQDTTLVGDTNKAILEYNQDVAYDYYDSIKSTIENHMNLASEADSPEKASMEPSVMGVDDEAALFTIFDKLKVAL